MKNNREEKEQKINWIQIILASGVIASIISSTSSLIVSCSANERLEKIETQKYQYNLSTTRYEKLQEALEYFSSFKLYDSEYIHRFDISSDEYSIDGVLDMMDDSIGQFVLQLYSIAPYLSDEAYDILESAGAFEEDILKTPDININNVLDDEEVNEVYKEHLNLANSKFDNLCSIIIKAITYDIYNEYVPK